MPSVAAKELKNRLGHFLRLVRRGACFLVTDHGRPVAQLAPLAEQRAHDALEDALQEAAARGAVTLAKRRKLSPVRPVRVRKGAELSTAVIEDRR